MKIPPFASSAPLRESHPQKAWTHLGCVPTMSVPTMLVDDDVFEGVYEDVGHALET